MGGRSAAAGVNKGGVTVGVSHGSWNVAGRLFVAWLGKKPNPLGSFILGNEIRWDETGKSGG